MTGPLPRVFGEYALLGLLGQGAAGQAYLARPLDPRRGIPTPVVIKTLHADLASSEEFIRRFHHEAELAVCVDSPHVAGIYEAGRARDGLYIAFEHVPGPSLSRFFSMLIAAGRYAPIALAVALAKDALRGLAALHSAKDKQARPLGVIHRDISPKNMILGEDGVLRLIDLGFGKSRAQDWKTETGIVLGSLGYMAPEQILAQPIDHRIDIFAMGVVLFELLTARRYIKHDTVPAMIQTSLNQSFIAPSSVRSDVPRSLDAIARCALDRDPDRRFQTAEEFIEAFDEVVTAEYTPAQITAFLSTIADDTLDKQRREIARMLALEVPEREDDQETAIYAVRERTAITELVQQHTELKPVPERTLLIQERSQPAAPVQRSRAFLAAAALTLVVGVAGGMLLVSSLFAPADQVTPVVLPTPAAAPTTTPRATAPPRAEPTHDEEAEEPASAESARARPARKRANTVRAAEEPAPPAPPPAEQSVDALAGGLERRAAALKARIEQNDPALKDVEALLVDVSLVRGSRNSARAIEQLRAIERRLNAIEAR